MNKQQTVGQKVKVWINSIVGAVPVVRSRKALTDAIVHLGTA